MSPCQLQFKVKVRDQVQLAGIHSDSLGRSPDCQLSKDRAGGQVSSGQGMGLGI